MSASYRRNSTVKLALGDCSLFVKYMQTSLTASENLTIQVFDHFLHFTLLSLVRIWQRYCLSLIHLPSNPPSPITRVYSSNFSPSLNKPLFLLALDSGINITSELTQDMLCCIQHNMSSHSRRRLRVSTREARFFGARSAATHREYC